MIIETFLYRELQDYIARMQSEEGGQPKAFVYLDRLVIPCKRTAPDSFADLHCLPGLRLGAQVESLRRNRLGRLAGVTSVLPAAGKAVRRGIGKAGYQLGEPRP